MATPKAIMSKATSIKDKSLELLQAAKEGFTKEKQDKLLMEGNHFTASTEYTARAENIRPDRAIISREDPNNLRTLTPAILIAFEK